MKRLIFRESYKSDSIVIFPTIVVTRYKDKEKTETTVVARFLNFNYGFVYIKFLGESYVPTTQE